MRFWNSVKSLNGHRQTLKEVARFLYISCDYGHTPTKFFDECHPRGIDGAHCLKSDWYEMVGGRQLAVLADLPVGCQFSRCSDHGGRLLLLLLLLLLFFFFFFFPGGDFF